MPLETFAPGGSVERVICILESQSLADLHGCLRDSFDRSEDRSYEFAKLGEPVERGHYVPASEMSGPVAKLAAGTTEETAVGSVLGRRGDRIAYLFDPDAQWQHIIELLDVDRSYPDHGYPRLVAMRGKSPPQEGDTEATHEPDEDA